MGDIVHDYEIRGLHLMQDRRLYEGSDKHDDRQSDAFEGSRLGVVLISHDVLEEETQELRLCEGEDVLGQFEEGGKCECTAVGVGQSAPESPTKVENGKRQCSDGRGIMSENPPVFLLLAVPVVL